MVNSGHLANKVSQSLIVASGAVLQWTLPSLATRGTAMKEQSNQQNPQKKSVSLKCKQLCQMTPEASEVEG